jgi:hypothetical protein
VLETVAPGGTSAPVPLPEDGPAVRAPAALAGYANRIGDYLILRELGRGGMGVVYEAEDVKLQRPVALKVMSPEVAARADARQRFLQEARATAALEHENVVAIYHVGEDRGVPFLAMPLLQGETLEQRLRREPKLPVAEAVRLAREAAEGLAAAHEKGLIHRDVKPANLWLTQSSGTSNESRGRLKVLDFGLARSLGGEAQLTSPGAFLGTPAYVAPEQARGEEVDGRADLFSLGCVLYRMLTGQRPFSGETAMAQLRSLELDEPRTPQQLDPTIPPPVSQLTMRLLAKKPAERPQSAGAVVKWMRAIEGNLLPSGPYPVAIPVMPPAPPPAATEATLALPPSVPAGGGRRWRYVLAASLLAVAVVSVTWGTSLAFRKPAESGSRARPGGTKDGGPGAGGEAVATWVIPPRAPEPPGGAPLGGSKDALVSRPAKIDGLESWTIETTLFGPAWSEVSFDPKDPVIRLRGSELWRHVDLRTGRDVDPPRDGKYLEFSPDGAKWLTVEGQAVLIGDAGDREKKLTLGHSPTLACAAFSPSGERVVVADRTELTLYDAKIGTKVKAAGWPIDRIGVFRLCWSPGGGMIAGIAQRNFNASTVFVYEVASGRLVREFQRADVATSVVWSPDSRLLAIGCRDSFEVWEVAKEGGPLMRHASNNGVIPAWSPRGKVLASARGKKVVLWDVERDVEVRELEGHRKDVTAIGFTPAGSDTLVSASEDRTVRFWHAGTGEHLGSMLFFSTGKVLAFSAAGHWTGSEGVETNFIYQIQPIGDGPVRDLKPDEFAERYGSMKDEKKVNLLAPTKGGDR